MVLVSGILVRFADQAKDLDDPRWCLTPHGRLAGIYLRIG
jgi:hypothetical protein